MIEKKIKEFDEIGYTILENVIPNNKVQKINKELQETADKYGKNNNGVTYLATTINFCQSFDKYLIESNLQKLIKHFLGDDFRISSTSTQINETNNKKGDWHADWPFCVFNGGNINKPFPKKVLHITGIFMLVDFNKNVGSTLVKPKSHLLETNPTFEGDPYYGKYDDQVNIEGRAGSVFLMDSRLWHASDTNKSNIRRTSLVVRYAPWWLNLEVFRPGSYDRKKIIEDKNKFGSLYPSVTKNAFDKIDDDVKPLFEHWLE
tara:strand:+ start:536 stop:1318 length:783 start_codon:yes stop_codon:yes gene_type:complete